MIEGTVVGTPPPTNEEFATDLTETTDNHYRGEVVLFTSGALKGQSSVIEEYVGATKLIGVLPYLTEAPSAGDSFIIFTGFNDQRLFAELLSITDLLDNPTYGLAALNTDLDTILTRVPTEVAQKLHLVHGTGNITPPTNKGIWDYLPTIDTIDTTTLWTYDNSVELLKRIQAIPEFDSILWKTGGALCPTGKSLWDYLPYLDVAISTRAPETGGNLAAVKTDVDNLEIPIKFPSPIAQDNVSTTSPTDTTEEEITVSLPSGASRVRAMLAAFVTAKNGAATAQDIDISVSGRPQGGSWTTLISTLTDCLGLPDVDKATTGDAYMVDVTNLITGAGTWGFRVTITLSSAATVRFKTEYLLIVTYKMS